MIDDLRLEVGGVAIEGWESIRVTRGIERCPSEFSVGMTERYPGNADVATVTPGKACKVYLGKDLVVTGYVNRFSPSINGKSHSVTVSGRGKCQDLVDCSAQWPGNQFSNVTVLTIAQSLAKFYGVNVHALADPKDNILQLNVMRGETPFQIIERVCRYVALLAYEGADGSLILANAGKSKHASGLKQGVNVEEAAAMFADDTQYSQYDVYTSNFNSYKEVGENGFLIYPLHNKNVSRTRIMDIIADNGDPGSVIAIKRAMWEMNRRFGRSNVVHVTTDGWRDSAGKLYEPNRLIEVDIPILKVPKRTWLIGEVTYRRDAHGTACDLTMMPPEAFAPEPVNLFPTWKELANTQGTANAR